MSAVSIANMLFEALALVALAVVYTPVRVVLAELKLAPREIPEWLMKRAVLDFGERIAELNRIEVRAIEPGWAFLFTQGKPIAIQTLFSLFEDPELDFRDYVYAKTRFKAARGGEGDA